MRGIALLTAALLVSLPLAAQRLPRRRLPPPPPPPAATVAQEPGWLGSRFGTEAVERQLATGDPAARELALERLASLGTTRALSVLSAALEPDGAARTQRERLVAVRALAAHAAEPEARLALLRLMSGGAHDPRDELGRLVQQTAALALAQSGTAAALAALGKALRQEGALAELAARAIEAHPPEALGPVLAAPGPATPTLVRLLGALGDQRAFFELRRAVRRGGVSVRAEAAIALTRLGDFETVELARHWRKTERAAELRLAAAQILSFARAPDAPLAVLELLRDPELDSRALELALEAPHPAFESELTARLARSDAVEAPRILGALSRAGAVAPLERALKNPAHAPSAAHALALAPGSAAADAIGRALREPGTRRLATRAAAFRQAVLGDRVGGLAEALEVLLRSSEAADRAAAAWALALGDSDRAVELLASRDAAVVRAAARAALDPKVAVAAAARLGKEPDGTTQAALALALAVSVAADRVPTQLLIELFESSGPAAPLAARALASRNTADLFPRIEAMLESVDELSRAHAALGLGNSDSPRALAWLVRTYRFETSAEVRRAVVMAASQRSELARRNLLRLAATLDPDVAVRQAARRALAGERLDPLATGASGAWITLAPNTPASLDSAAGRPLIMQTPGGVAFPVVTDPDGVMCLAPLAEGPVRIRLAAPPIRGKPGLRGKT
jgi:hypothetical protein